MSQAQPSEKPRKSSLMTPHDLLLPLRPIGARSQSTHYLPTPAQLPANLYLTHLSRNRILDQIGVHGKPRHGTDDINGELMRMELTMQKHFVGTAQEIAKTSLSRERTADTAAPVPPTPDPELTKTQDSTKTKIFKIDERLSADPWDENYAVIVTARERYVRNIGKQKYEEIELVAIEDDSLGDQVVVRPPKPQTMDLSKILQRSTSRSRPISRVSVRVTDSPAKMIPVRPSTRQMNRKRGFRRRSGSQAKVAALLHRLVPQPGSLPTSRLNSPSRQSSVRSSRTRLRGRLQVRTGSARNLSDPQRDRLLYL